MLSEGPIAISTESAVAELNALGLRGDGVYIGHLDTPIAELAELNCRILERRHFAADGMSVEAAAPIGALHGTQMAGVLVAMAPQAQIFAGAVLEGGAVMARLLLGLDWLIQKSPQVICLPLGVPPPATILKRLMDACGERDILVVAAIGNLGTGRELAPAIMDGVLSVGSENAHGRGSQSVRRIAANAGDPVVRPDVLAPGSGLKTVSPDGRPSMAKGTSAATALVAGVAALLRGAYPDVTAQGVVEAICATANHGASSDAHQTKFGSMRPIEAYEWLKVGNIGVRPMDVCRNRVADREIEIDVLLADALAATPAHRNVTFAIETQGRLSSLVDLDTTKGEEMRPLKSAPVTIIRCSVEKARSLLESANCLSAWSSNIDRSYYVTPLAMRGT